MNLTDELYDFAFFFDFQSDLRELAKMAMPESWTFLHPQYPTFNTETPILEKYIRSIYRYQAISYNQARDQAEKDRIITFSGAWACFHAGLMTPFFQEIYALFELNRRRDTRYDWVFKGFHAAGSARLRCMPVLPHKPNFGSSDAYHPEWNIRINFAHILQDNNNLQRIPSSVRRLSNLPLLLHAAVLYARALAAVDPSVIVPQVYCRQRQFLMPICLTDVKKCDLALTLMPCDGYYFGSTCLTLEMAYQNARILSRPSAFWLSGLVQESPVQQAFPYEYVYGMHHDMTAISQI